MKSFGSLVPYAEPLWYSRDVSLHYTASHRKLRAAVRKYVDEELIPFAFEWETAGVVPDHVSTHQLLLQNYKLHFLTQQRHGKDMLSWVT